MKRILSLLLALCMVFTLVSSTVYATGSGEFNVDDTVCENHKEHDESCGYIKAAEGAPCSHQNEDGTFSCAPDGDSSYVCPHDDGCGYTHAAEGAPCTHECELCGDESRQECTCNTLCTEDEMNPDCPICGVEGADPSLCESASDAHLLTTLRNAITIDTTLDLGSVTTDTNCTIAGSHTHGDNFCWAWYTSGVELEGKSYTGNVLVLNGVDITCTDDTTGILVPENTTIVTVSDSVNTVTAADNDSGDSYGIYGLGDLTFDGNGTLNIVGGEATDGLSYGIYALGKVRIKGGIVNAKGGVSGSSGGKGPFTVSFDSDGGQAFEPVTVAKGGTLTDLPVPGKSGCVFTAWYLDETPVGTDTEFYSDATLVAKYETLSGNELQYTDTTYTLTKVSPDQSFTISAAGKTAEQVKAGLTFEILDNSGDVELQVTGSNRTFTVKAKDGFTPGGAYRLTLGSGLRFSGQDDTVRNCEFTIDREEVFELEFNQDLNFLSMDNLSNIVQNGKVVRTLNSPLYQFTSQSTSRITKDSGTFRLNSGTLGVGDVVCFYSGEKPEVGDDEAYLNDNIAYVKITAVNGNVYSYVTAEPEEVLQMPDVLPVSSTADTDGDADNLSITVAKNSFDYSAPQYAESGLNAATTVDEGDFLFFYSGTYGMSAEAVGYGRVTSVEQFGDYLVVTYEEATEDDIENVLNYYSENDVDAKKLIQDIDISELETDIENQAKQSGFADAAAAYLIDTALKTDGFNNALEGFDPDTMQVMLEDGSSVSLSALQAAKNSVKPVLTNLKVKAQIGTNSVHFDGNGIRTALDISFTLTIFNQDNQGVNLTVSASFVEELKMEVSASGDTIWKKKWIFPYIADYQFNTNLDVYNYTSIDIRSQVTDKEGYTIADISNEIKRIIEMTNGEDIKSGVSNLYDLYDELLDTDGDWVKIFEKQISKMDMRLLLGIINVRFTTAFVVSVDMRVALGMQYEYFSADRYCFWTRIKAKEADSNTIRLEDQKTTFQFYVVGTVGIRAGIKIEIAVGLFSVDIASVGLGAEAGAYLRLSGYFYYTTTSTNNVITSSKTAGALYMEIGVYLDVTFNAQVLGGKFQYSPSLFYKEWPIIKAGRQKNVQDFAAADGLTEINLKLYEKNFTLPEGFYDLKYLDMANGEYSTVQPNDKDLEIITTNPAVTVQGRQIKINPGAATTVRATITVRYKNGQLAFSSMPITRTLKVYWSALDDRSYIKFAWGNLETIAAPPGDPITPPVEPTRSGYDFDGWYTDAECKNAYSFPAAMPEGDVTLYAKWTPQEVAYQVMHYQQALKGGTNVLVDVDELTGLTGSTPTLAYKTYPGFDNPTAQPVAINGDGSTVIRLIYPRKNYTITLENISNNSGQVIELEVPYGQTITLPVIAREGHTFTGWDKTPPATMPANNLTYTANWTRNKYNVEYTLDNVKLEDESKDYLFGSDLYKPTPKPGYEFSGWYTDAACKIRFTQNTTPGRDIKLFGVTYDATGGTISGTPAKSLMWGAPLPKDIEITRENFEFVGWYRDRAMSGDPVAVMPNENVTLYARWKLKDDLEGQELNFGIELGGKAITSKNYTNLSALLGSDLQAGTITYDPGANVLTLSNVLYEPYPFYSKTSKYNLPAIIFANTPDTAFVIKLVGDNKIHYNWQSGSGVLTRYVIDVTAKELIITTDSKDVRGTLTSDPNTTERIYASIGITLRENTDRITVNNAAQVLMYLNPDGSEKTHGIYKVGAATSNLSVNIHDNASLALLSINGPPANFVKASLNVNSTNARLVLGGNLAFGDGAPSGTSIDDIIYTINLSTVGKYYTYSGSLPSSASQLDSKINTESTSQRLDVRLKAIRIGSTPVFPENTSASRSLSIKDAVMPLNFVPRNAVTLLSTATETETASSGCGIYAESITITGGTVTAAGEKAMNIAPDLSGYGNYIATASADVEGEDAVTYNPEEIEGYCYFHVESAPTYGVTLSHSGTYPFPNATAGYEAQTPLTVTVTNAGNQATGELTVALSGDNADSFTLSSESISDIPSAGSDSFTIAPVTGLDAGTYTAIVTVSGENDILASFSVSFTVLAPVTLTSMSIQTEPRTNYFEGETLDLSGLVVTLHYNNGDVKTVPFAEFETNGLIAEPANGTVLAASSTKVTITHEATDKLVELPITVTEASSVVNVTGVTVSPKNVMLYSNITTKAAQLKASVTPENATDKSVSWHSSNPAVATVDANGKVTALSNGTATITVTTTDGGFTDSCVVTVSTYRSGGSSGGSSSDTKPSSNFLTTTNNTGIGIDISSINLPEGVTLVSPHIYGLPTSTTGRAWTLLLTKAPTSVGRGGVLGGRKYLALYQFKLLDENGKEVHNVGWTTIRLPLPKGANPSSLMVLYYDDKARTFTNMGARVEGDFLVFKTSHFSYYMITGVPESVPAIPETGGGNPSEVPQTEVTITPIPAIDSKRRRLIG